jgi:REP element-mobilizing transposase RayT
MARPLRIEYEGALYHVTSRGNDRGCIFFTDTDREAFLELLGDAVERFSWICHAYCLMTNHYHLVVETPHANLSRGMRHINGVFTQRINRLNKRSGHLLQGRFKSILVEKESYLLELVRYVVLNPVRAKMVRSTKDWKWSSYRATSGQAEVPAFLTVEWILSQFDRDLPRAQKAYRRFVRQGRGVDIWSELRYGYLLGSESFDEQLQPLLEERRGEIEIPRTERLATRPTLDDLFSDVHDKPTRNERIHRAMRVHEYTLKELSAHLGLHYSTISVIAKRVEEAQKHQK